MPLVARRPRTRFRILRGSRLPRLAPLLSAGDALAIETATLLVEVRAPASGVRRHEFSAAAIKFVLIFAGQEEQRSGGVLGRADGAKPQGLGDRRQQIAVIRAVSPIV